LVVAFSGDDNGAAKIVPEVLEMVLVNLLDNSRQSGADRVEVAVDQAGGAISIRITDNGQGISPANAEKIFTPFFTTHREEGGTGLGLGIVRSLLKAYSGDISVEPSSAGATFRVTLPRAE
jgi:signal transduction histidine kinase